jgi:hypothetical protein
MSAERQFRLTHHDVLGLAASLLVALLLLATSARAASLTFTVNASEPVTVTGTPRVAIDVGGTTRYATYASGSGTSALTFSYAVQPGDFDANGITLASPVDLNGGSISDIAGNPASALTFTLPDTSSIKVQTYTAAFTTSPITNANATAVSFAIAKAPTGASFSYTITSSGGLGSVTGSGTISGATHAVANIDISNLAVGTLTLSATVSTPAGGTGTAKTATAVPVLSGALDSLPSAAALFSLRPLRGAYTGPLLRVRRASDDAQRDIAATFSGNLDTATLTGFCGSSSCFVPAWYDQSGNTRDAVQATAANQPRIVNAGSVELEGGKPTLRYTATGRVLAAPSIPQTVQGTINAVARSTNSAVDRHIMGDLGAGAVGRILRAVSGGGSYFGANFTAAQVTLPGSTLQQRVVTIVSGLSGMSGALDGVISTGGTSSTYKVSSVNFLLGGAGPATGADWIGTISEVSVFTFTMSASDRQTLERNQGSYYGISVQ